MTATDRPVNGPIAPDETITLTLTLDQATVLNQVLANVSTDRRYFNSIDVPGTAAQIREDLLTAARKVF